ncbi:unnamed protein product [Cuscuta europaea]|nr:unnamed protein product [Cuscuta europaea]
MAGAGTPALPTTGFQLKSGQSVSIPCTPKWSGRIWARTGCTFDTSGAGSCETGDCGGKLECSGMGGKSPCSLFEITLGGWQDKDFYDVSLVDGYNLPMIIAPLGAQCNSTGCVSNLNMGCPTELQMVGGAGAVIGCKSACEAFQMPEYCCSEEYANPTTCKPSFYSKIFKNACPSAYSYAFDDGTSTFTCKADQYQITFCPNGTNSGNNPTSAPLLPPSLPSPPNGSTVATPLPPPSSPPNGGTIATPLPPPPSPPSGSTVATPLLPSPPNGGTVATPPPSPPNGGTVAAPLPLPLVTPPPPLLVTLPPAPLNGGLGIATPPPPPPFSNPVDMPAPPAIPRLKRKNGNYMPEAGIVSSSKKSLPFSTLTITFMFQLFLRL